MKTIHHFIIILFCLSIALTATEKNRFSKVKIVFESQDQITQLAKSGLIFDHVQFQKEPDARFSYTVILDKNEVDILSSSGLEHEIIITDVVEEYKQRQQKSAIDKTALDANDPLQGFELGSLGGFYTFDEMVSELDSMFMLYPQIITEKDSIGSTHEGRPIWMVKISDNPNNDEDEPQVLYNAMHHAREPGSMMTVMYFIYYLLENYETDPEVTYLVDNRELYFVPIVNPDGYEFNREMRPDGGYLWRKNKRDNNLDSLFTEDSDGVDLNRNYGHEWAFDDQGSSPNINLPTYRGPGPFSEPETQAIAELCLNKNFKIALNYHTYGNLLIYPWGYIASFETPDSNIFRELASEITRFNNYTYGTGDQTVGYLVNGDSDDWMYGEQILKNKVFSMTPEVGSGFWPDASTIYPYAQENVYANLFTAWAAAGVVRYIDYSVNYANNNDYIEAGTESEITFTLENIGLGNSENVYIKLSSEDSLVSIAKKSITINSLAPRDTVVSGALKFLMDPQTLAGYIAEFNLEIEQGGVTTVLPIEGLIVGKPVSLFTDGFEVGNNKWIFDSPWARTNEKPYSDFFSFSDSPTGNYRNNINSSLYLQDTIRINNVNAAYLEFWTCWEIESELDFAQVQASTDTLNWKSLQGFYTQQGSGLGRQSVNSFGYDGNQKKWVKERISLNDYINSGPFYLRFNVQSDENVTGDGWYIDDINIVVYSDSTVSALEEKQRISNKFALHQNYPNPFNPTTHIRFELQKSSNVEITIFDSLGKKVRTLINEQRSAGQYTLLWNGTNDNGQLVSSGLYFYVMHSETFQSRKKLILLR